MRFISLDLSSKTGWAWFETVDDKLTILDSGNMDPIPLPENGWYPKNYLEWSKTVFEKILDTVLSRYNFDYVVIEETAKGSKDAHSQKFLEWLHFHIAMWCVETIEKNNIKGVYYLQTGEWRTAAGCHMTKEEKKRNQKVTKARNKAESEGKKIVLVEIEPGKKKVGKVSKKHVAIRRVKEIFDIDLKMKDNDRADALLLGYAAYNLYFKKGQSCQSQNQDSITSLSNTQNSTST